MPLEKGAKPGTKGFKKNIKTEVNAGKPQKQAVAIAYSESRQKDNSPEHFKRLSAFHNAQFNSTKGLLAIKHYHASNHYASAASHLEEGNKAKAENSRGLAELSAREAATLGGKTKDARMFPSYTLAQLKEAAARGVTSVNNAENIKKIKEEVARRESGESVHKVTPQVKWGKDSVSVRKDAKGAVHVFLPQSLNINFKRLRPMAFDKYHGVVRTVRRGYDTSKAEFEQLKKLLSKFLTEEENEPEHDCDCSLRKDSSPEMEAFRARQKARVDAADAGARHAMSLASRAKAADLILRKLGRRGVGENQAERLAKSAAAEFSLAKNNISVQTTYERWMAEATSSLRQAEDAVVRLEQNAARA